MPPQGWRISKLPDTPSLRNELGDEACIRLQKIHVAMMKARLVGNLLISVQRSCQPCAQQDAHGSRDAHR